MQPHGNVSIDPESFIPNKYFSFRGRSINTIDIYRDHKGIFPKLPSIPKKKVLKITQQVDDTDQRQYENFVSYWNSKFAFQNVTPNQRTLKTTESTLPNEVNLNQSFVMNYDAKRKKRLQKQKYFEERMKNEARLINIVEKSRRIVGDLKDPKELFTMATELKVQRAESKVKIPQMNEENRIRHFAKKFDLNIFPDGSNLHVSI